MVAPSRPAKKSHWLRNVLAAVGLAVLTCLCLIIATVQAPAVTNTSAPAQPSTATVASIETAVATATPLSPNDQLLALARQVYGDGMRSASLESIEGGMQAKIEYDVGAQWDENSLVESVVRDFINFAPKVFNNFDAVTLLEVDSVSNFTDVYGNSRPDFATKFIITRQTSDKINWPEFDPKNLACVLTSQGDLMGLSFHPSLIASWNRYENTGVFNPSPCG